MVTHRKKNRIRFDWLLYVLLGLIAVGSVFIINLNYKVGTPVAVPPAAAPVSSPVPYVHHPAPVPQEAAERVYAVQRGDTLWSIAQDHLGTGTDWPQLYTMNRETIGGNPNIIRAGEKLKL